MDRRIAMALIQKAFDDEEKKENQEMPCHREPMEHETKRSELNKEADRLHDWLKSKLGDPNLDATGRLCATIRSLGNMGFTNLCVENIGEREARQLLGWWESHQDYDAKYGRK